MYKKWYKCNEIKASDAASGWAGWALAHPEFGSSDYAHHITACPPGFENLTASLKAFFKASIQKKTFTFNYLVDFVNWFGGLWSCFATFNSFGFVKAVISHPALPIKQLSVEIALGDLAPE
jgi:hypothetical protein